ncbi:DUF389 domain-containing protein [Microbacterium esteraromaticum]|uniref:DUF389 domain-containing protein n=1 Tax=Microbacterium esteraromaticum TaxID=57043 RepID=A0A939DV10_9MICO|nr:DUF389 domain-containing protein [Microbacterium esteraromaticum]
MTLDDQADTVSPPPASSVRERFRAMVAALSNPAGVRGLLAMAGGTVVLLLPNATTMLVTFIVVALLALSGATDLGYAASGRRWFGKGISRWLAALRGLAALALAAAMVLAIYAAGDALTLTLVVGFAGIFIGIRGVVAIIGALLKRRERDPLPRLAGGSIAVIAGILAYLVPSSVVSTVIIGGAVAALVLGLLLVAWSLRHSARGTTTVPPTATVPELIWDWIDGSDIGRKQRAEYAAGLYFERPQRLTKLGTWWVMLVLSVAIASFAVLADSTAVVIGAMLVAPLMTPILGLAGALVNGWGRRAFDSATLIVAGALAAVALAYGISAWAPIAISHATNSQIVSRVSPTTVDMLIAIAAGAAGAFATVNARVASGIAGVAIAVALVPPLAVVGISLNGGQYADAGGATLLFLTNFVAIVLSASAVFVLTGFARPYALRNRPRQIMQTVVPFIALAGIILLPLMLTSEGILQSQNRQRDVQHTVEDWLGDDTDFVVSDISVTGDTVSITISGPGEPPQATDLHESLQDGFTAPIGLELTVIPVEVTVVPSGG